VTLHVAGIRLQWEIPIPGQILVSFWRITPVYEVECQPDPQKTRPWIRTRILSHHALFYDSPFGLGVNLKKRVKKKKVTQSLYVINVLLEAGLTYRHGTFGKC
jgi:hypothetical protein